MRSILYFKKLVKEGQINTAGGEYLVSKVYFDLEIGHSMHSGLTATIKQELGHGSESAPLEVSEPEGYEGSFNYGGFVTPSPVIIKA